MREKEKYRPYLSLSQVKLVLSLLSTHNPEEKELISSLKLIELKSESGLSTPAYISTPRKPSRFSPEGLGLTFTDSRKAAYQRFCETPNLLTPGELRESNEYRYENDLMTKEEMKAWEKELGIS